MKRLGKICLTKMTLSFLLVRSTGQSEKVGAGNSRMGLKDLKEISAVQTTKLLRHYLWPVMSASTICSYTPPSNLSIESGNLLRDYVPVRNERRERPRRKLNPSIPLAASTPLKVQSLMPTLLPSSFQIRTLVCRT